MSGHLVHLEIELPQRGIIKSHCGSEISLKIGIFRLFESFDCGTIETPTLIVAVWQECGYFYIFYPNATGPDGVNGKGSACVIRFTTKAHLYNSLMHNIPKDCESHTFEIRSFDFTLSPLRGRPLRVAEGPKVDVVKKSSTSTASLKQRRKKVKRQTTCYKMMPCNQEILCGTVACPKKELALMQKQVSLIAEIFFLYTMYSSVHKSQFSYCLDLSEWCQGNSGYSYVLYRRHKSMV